MRLLRDTSIVLYTIGSTARLDDRPLALLDDSENTVLSSAARRWDIAIKSGLRRPDCNVGPEDVLSSAEPAGFEQLPVRGSIATRVANLPTYHRDPFDRLLVAQAMAEPAIFLTQECMLARYSELVAVVPDHAT